MLSTCGDDVAKEPSGGDSIVPRSTCGDDSMVDCDAGDDVATPTEVTDDAGGDVATSIVATDAPRVLRWHASWDAISVASSAPDEAGGPSVGAASRAGGPRVPTDLAAIVASSKTESAYDHAGAKKLRRALLKRPAAAQMGPSPKPTAILKGPAAAEMGPSPKRAKLIADMTDSGPGESDPAKAIPDKKITHRATAGIDTLPANTVEVLRSQIALIKCAEVSPEKNAREGALHLARLLCLDEKHLASFKEVLEEEFLDTAPFLKNGTGNVVFTVERGVEIWQLVHSVRGENGKSARKVLCGVTDRQFEIRADCHRKALLLLILFRAGCVLSKIRLLSYRQRL